MKTHIFVLSLAVLLFTLSALGQGSQKAPGSEDLVKTGSKEPTKILEYKQIDGKKLTLHVFEPAGHKAADKKPSIILFHGGSWQGGEPSQFYGQCEYLARRGMVGMSAEYRLTPQKVTLAQIISDAKSAIRWTRAHAAELGIDPDRIAAGGGSAGGHLAAAAAVLDTLDEKGEDLSVSSKPNLLVLFNPAFFHPGAQKTLTLDDFTKNTPPMLIMFGNADAMLEYGRQCKERSRQQGNEVRLFVADKAKHGFFSYRPNFEHTLLVTDRFLAEHGYLQGEPTVKPPSGPPLTEESGFAGARIFRVIDNRLPDTTLIDDRKK